jgi:hypothetical protein
VKLWVFNHCLQLSISTLLYPVGVF